MASGPEPALAALWTAGLVLEAGNALVELLTDEILVAHGFGRLEVASHESGKPLRQYADLPPKEAIAYFRSKRLVSSSKYRRLEGAAKRRALSAAGLQRQYQLQAVHEELLAAIQQGTPHRQVVQRLGEVYDRIGVTARSPHYLQLVHRNAVTEAYATGRWVEMRKLTRRRPYWRYRTVGDEHVRPTHRAMDGRTYRHDDPIWAVWYPPCGHKCRCRVESHASAELDEGLPEIDGKPVAPDPGWSHSPAQDASEDQVRLGRQLRKLRVLQPPTPGKARIFDAAGDLGPADAAKKARRVDALAGVSPAQARQLADARALVAPRAPSRLAGSTEITMPVPSQYVGDLDQLVQAIADETASPPTLRQLTLDARAHYAAGQTTEPHFVSTDGIVRSTDAVLSLRGRNRTVLEGVARAALRLEDTHPAGLRHAVRASDAMIRGWRGVVPDGWSDATLNTRVVGRGVEMRLSSEPLQGYTAERVLVSVARAKAL